VHAMLRGARVRHGAWCVGGLRAVLWQWASGGLPLPQAKAPSTVARLVIHFGPEPPLAGLRFICVVGGGGSQEWADALLDVHTPSKNPQPISGM
jgi:hypothetical protein